MDPLQTQDSQILPYIEPMTEKQRNKKKRKHTPSDELSTPLNILVTAANQGLNESSHSPSKKKMNVSKETPKFVTRTSPSGLHNLIQHLSEEQKDAVREIGFGSLLSLSISRFPSEFFRSIVALFNSRRRSIVLKSGEEVEIEEDDVQCVLNIPRGKLDIVESIGVGPDEQEYKENLETWRRRWGIYKHSGAPNTHDMPKKILQNTTGDSNFQIDFVVYVVSSFLCTSQNPQCRFKILKSLIDVSKIKDYNWCKFTLDGLVESSYKWHQNKKSFFHGPLTFLLLCYLDRVAEHKVDRNIPRSFPILACWDDKKVNQRIKFESKHGGYGQGRVIACISIPFFEEEQQPLNIVTDQEIPQKRLTDKELPEEEHPQIEKPLKKHPTKEYLKNPKRSFTSPLAVCLSRIAAATEAIARDAKTLHERGILEPVKVLQSALEPFVNVVNRHPQVMEALTRALEKSRRNIPPTTESNINIPQSTEEGKVLVVQPKETKAASTIHPAKAATNAGPPTDTMEIHSPISVDVTTKEGEGEVFDTQMKETNAASTIPPAKAATNASPAADTMEIHSPIPVDGTTKEGEGDVFVVQPKTSAVVAGGSGERFISPQEVLDATSARAERRTGPIWFSLMAAELQEGIAPLPQIPASLRIRDGSLFDNCRFFFVEKLQHSVSQPLHDNKVCKDYIIAEGGIVCQEKADFVRDDPCAIKRFVVYASERGVVAADKLAMEIDCPRCRVVDYDWIVQSVTTYNLIPV